jgi:hypothetical protein
MNASSNLHHTGAISPYIPTKTDPVSLSKFALITGLKASVLRKYCNQGRVLGARQHHLSKQWWIYPPAVIMPNQKRW